MKVTVCQLHDDPAGLESDWAGLVAHVRAEESNVVLLPEMPFSPWFATLRMFEPATWAAAVAAHTAWEARLKDLAPAAVIASRPIDFGNERYNEGFVWDAETGIRGAHAKSFLPDEEGVWEASWYHRATPEFTPGRAAAIAAGAFGLSSNRFDKSGAYGGQGWVVGPDGEVLALTSASEPFVSVRIDLEAAEKAKSTYPRYAITQAGFNSAAPRPARAESRSEIAV
jgi:predicted amidohydrolase